jgi:ribonuclease HI
VELGKSYTSIKIIITLSATLRLGTNNKAELSTLWALLFQADYLQIHKLQVFGDSQVVIDWINGLTCFQVRRLRPLMSQIRDFIANMDWFNCKHILLELNEEVDFYPRRLWRWSMGILFFRSFMMIILSTEFNIIL